MRRRLRAHGEPSVAPRPAPPGAGTAPKARGPPLQEQGPLLAPRPRLADRSLAPLDTNPAPGTAQPRPSHGPATPHRVTAPDTCESGDCCVWQPSSEVHRLGLAFPLVSPKVTEAFVSRKSLLVAPGVPPFFFWCLIGMLLVVLVLLLPTVSGRSLQSVRAGGEPERLARPADRNRGWEEICF